MSSEELQDILKEIPIEELSKLGIRIETEEPEPSRTHDYVGIKMQIISFVKDLLQQNMALEWEINKRKPNAITVEDVISKSSQIYNFVTSED